MNGLHNINYVPIWGIVCIWARGARAPTNIRSTDENTSIKTIFKNKLKRLYKKLFLFFKNFYKKFQPLKFFINFLVF